MRFVLILLLTLALALTWQSTVLAGIAADNHKVYADESKEKAKDGKKGGSGDAEPDCE